MSIIASYIWKSLMDGKKIVDKGIIWRIGNGKCVKVAGDPWLCNCLNYNLPDPIDSRCYGLDVCNLIEHGEWNEDLINDLLILRLLARS